MQPDEFRKWRKGIGLKQKDAAEKLGLKKRVIQYYEKGDRDGKPVDIPKTVELACLALSLGFESFDGEPVAAFAGGARGGSGKTSQNADEADEGDASARPNAGG